MVGHSFLRHLACRGVRAPWLFLTVALLLAAGSLWLTAARLEFKTDRNDLVSSHQNYVKLAREYEAEFRGLNDFIVVVRTSDPARARQFADRLAAELLKPAGTRDGASPRRDDRPQDSKPTITDIFYRFDDDLLEGKKLVLLGSDELASLADGIEEHQDFLEGLFESPSLYQIFYLINQRMKQELVKTGVAALIGDDEEEDGSDEEDTRQIKFLSSLLRQTNAALEGPAPAYESPWAEFFGGESFDRDAYLTTPDKQYLVMRLECRGGQGFLKDVVPLNLIRGTIQRLRSEEFPGIEAGVTGQPALSADEMAAALSDMKVGAILALLGVAALYIVMFREIRRPLMVLASLLIGIAWTMGFLTLTIGHLTVLTIAFTSILIGLGIDFGFHLLTRYEEERAGGRELADALDVSLRQTLPSLLATALTTALAFFAVMLADFRGIQELGWISGGGLLLTFLSTILCLPALLAITEGKARGDRARRLGLAPVFSRAISEHRGAVLVGALVLSVLCLPAFRAVSFDYNLLNLQSVSTESVVWEKKLLEAAKESSWFGMTVAASEEELRLKEKQFESLPVVSKVRSILDIRPEIEEQKKRIGLIGGIRDTIEDLALEELPEPRALDVAKLNRLLDKVKFTLRSRSEKSEGALDEGIRAARRELLSLIDTIQSLPEEDVAHRLGQFQKPLFDDFEKKFGMLRSNLNPSPITEEDIPEAIRGRFVSQQGRYLMYIYSAKNIWQRENMLEFTRELRSVDPDVTGAPIIGGESIGLMTKGYFEGGAYAFAAIILVVLVTFRKLTDTVLCLAPVLVASIWTLGLMWLFGLQFNLANLVVIPLIIGIAVDGGIHLVHRVREEGSAEGLLTTSTSRAVLLSFLSTMIGFGCLMVADHYGIFSLGLLLTIAVGSALVVALTALPALLLYVSPQREAKEKGT